MVNDAEALLTVSKLNFTNTDVDITTNLATVFLYWMQDDIAYSLVINCMDINGIPDPEPMIKDLIAIAGSI